MYGYTKLFHRILDSTVWREDDKTRILWITMLAIADQDGIVYSTIPGLADRARISLADCERALERFQQPDKYSWSRDEEGRRIKPVEGGWFLINHAKYRALMSVEEQREKARLRMQRYRASHSVTPATGDECSKKFDIAEAEAKAEAKAKKVKSVGHFVPPTLEQVDAYCQMRGNKVDAVRWFNHYEAVGWRVGRNPMKHWKAAIHTWERGEDKPQPEQPEMTEEEIAYAKKFNAEERARIGAKR